MHFAEILQLTSPLDGESADAQRRQFGIRLCHDGTLAGASRAEASHVLGASHRRCQVHESGQDRFSAVAPNQFAAVFKAGIGWFLEIPGRAGSR